MQLSAFLKNLLVLTRVFLRPWFYLAVGLHAVLLSLPVRQEPQESQIPPAGDAIAITQLPTPVPSASVVPSAIAFPSPAESTPQPTPTPTPKPSPVPQSRPKTRSSPVSAHNTDLLRPRVSTLTPRSVQPSPSGTPTPGTSPTPVPTSTPSPTPTPISTPTPTPGTNSGLRYMLNNQPELIFKGVIAQIETQWSPTENKGLRHGFDKELLEESAKATFKESEFEFEYMTEPTVPGAPSQDEIASFLKQTFESQGFSWENAGSYGGGAHYKVAKDGYERSVYLAPAGEQRTAIILDKTAS